MTVGIAGWSETGVGTSAGVTVTHAAIEGQKHVVTEISCSSDAAAVVTVESPADTVKWRLRFAGAFTLNKAFAPGVLVGESGDAVLVKVSASTSNCEANISGYQRPW